MEYLIEEINELIVVLKRSKFQHKISALKVMKLCICKTRIFEVKYLLRTKKYIDFILDTLLFQKTMNGKYLKCC